MKKIIFTILVVIVVLPAILMTLAPKSEQVERSITINKPVTEVYTYMALLQNMEAWSPWAKKDPSAKHTYKGAGNTVGSVHYWESTHEEVGVGEQEITKLVPNKEIISDLRFKTPYESESIGYLKFDDEGSKTKVTWGYTARYNLIESLFMLFMDMDEMLGGEFEQGLADAKAIIEE